MPEVKTLVVVTRPVDPRADEMARLALEAADEIALIQSGVYNDIERMRREGLSFSGRVIALEEDVRARRVNTAADLVHHDGLVEAIEKNGKVVTI